MGRIFLAHISALVLAASMKYLVDTLAINERVHQL